MAWEVGEAVYEVVEGEGERTGPSSRRGIMECQARGQRFRTDSDAICQKRSYTRIFSAARKKETIFRFYKKGPKSCQKDFIKFLLLCAICASFALYPPSGEKRL